MNLKALRALHKNGGEASPHRTRRRLLALGAVAALTTALSGSLPALAVHTLDFCLQGDVTNQNSGQLGAPTAVCTAGQLDWTDFFNSSGGPKTTSLPTGTNGIFTDSSFKSDFALPDATTYATGSKDTLPISGNGSSNWQCAASKNLGAKVDLANTYATTYRRTSDSHTILYYGSEIQSANGDHNQGIWLLQDKNVGCSSGTGTTNFTGSHVNGDLLFAVALTGGGSKPFSASVVAFEWSCTNNLVTGVCSPATLASPAATIGSLVALNGGASIGSLCGSGGTDTACAITNETWNVKTPWPPHNTDATVLGPQQFFEGGIDVTSVLATFGGTAECFSRFLTDTRSSQSPTATLFDYTQDSLSTCAAPSVATALKKSDGTAVSVSNVTVGDQVYDTATMSGTLGTPSGSVDYKLYPSCTNDVTSGVGTGTGIFTTSPATYKTGTNINLPFTANPVSHVNLNADGTIPNSDTLQFTTTGTFYFIAFYNTDGINLAANSPCEPITINAAPTTLSTTATNPATPIVVGTTVTISDSATIHSAFGTPGGTMTFTLKGPATATSCGATITTIASVAVSSATTSSGDYSFSPTSVGTYYWSAVWTSDSNNVGSSHAGCSVDPVTLATVTDPAEAVVVVKATPKLITVPFLGDVGTIFGGFNPAGTLTFKLYADPAGTALAAQCGSAPVYTSPAITLSSLTASTYADLATQLAAASLSDGKIYNWQVVYTDSSGLNNNVTVGCGSSTGATGSTDRESTGPTTIHQTS